MRKGWQYSFQADSERVVAREAGDGSPCARGEWCASATRERLEDGTTVRTAVSTPRPFCDADAAIIGQCLRDFPQTWKRLWPALLDHVISEVNVRVPFGPGVPVRTDVDTVMRTIVDCCATWHERVAAVDQGLTPPGGVSGQGSTKEWHERSLDRHAPVLLADSSRRLAERVTVLLALGEETMVRPELVAALGCGAVVTDAGRCWQRALAERSGLEPGSADWLWVISRRLHVPAGTAMVDADGAAAGLEILRLDYVARAAMLETNPDTDTLLGVACEQCGRRSLRRAAPPMHEGDQMFFSACDDCGALMTDAEFRSWTAYLTRFYGRRVTPAVLASAGLRGDETPAIAAAAAA